MPAGYSRQSLRDQRLGIYSNPNLACEPDRRYRHSESLHDEDTRTTIPSLFYRTRFSALRSDKESNMLAAEKNRLHKVLDDLSFPRSSVRTQFWTLQRPDLEQGHEPKPIRHPGTG